MLEIRGASLQLSDVISFLILNFPEWRDKSISDSTVKELTIAQHGKEINLQEMSQTKRLHLRVAYDQYKKELYVITKLMGR